MYFFSGNDGPKEKERTSKDAGWIHRRDLLACLQGEIPFSLLLKLSRLDRQASKQYHPRLCKLTRLTHRGECVRGGIVVEMGSHPGSCSITQLSFQPQVKTSLCDC